MAGLPYSLRVFFLRHPCIEAYIAITIGQRHGMAIMLWDYAGEDWSEVVCCPTPERLFDELLDFCTAYHEYLILQSSGRNDLNAGEQEHVKKTIQHYQEKRKEAEKK